MANIAVIDPSGFSLPYDYLLCNALIDETQHQITLYRTSESNDAYALPSPRFNIYRHYYQRSQNVEQHRLRQILKGGEHLFDQARLSVGPAPDIYHFQWPPLPMVDLFTFKILQQKAPVVFTAHNVLPHEESLHDKFIRGLLYRNVDRIIVHTKSSKEKLVNQFQIPSNRINTIPHGNFKYLREFEPSKFKLSDEVQRLTDRPTILVFGLIREYKRLDRAIKALPTLQKEISDATLWVVGKPKIDMTQYIDLISDLGLKEDVIFVPEYISDEAISSYFEFADVALFPYEGIDQSGAALLAATLGIPVVATDVGGLGDIVVDGETGILVEEQNEAIAEALVSILDDSSKQHSMGNAARKRADTIFDWGRIARQTTDLYNELLNESDE